MTDPAPTYRREAPADAPAIERILLDAFPTDLEARLVVALREAGHLPVSLVAAIDDRVIGHVAFSPITVDGSDPAGGGAVGLAPLAVASEFRRRGVGSRLVERGLEACRGAGFGLVVVLGEPHFYGRLGFTQASRWGLVDEYDGGIAFQAIELRPGSIPAAGGLVRYAPAFGLFTDGAA